MNNMSGWEPHPAEMCWSLESENYQVASLATASTLLMLFLKQKNC